MADYECALTGQVAEPAEADPQDRDGLKDLPVGWTKITFSRRQMNSRYMMLMQVQNAIVEGALNQVPAEVAELQRIVLTAQVEAQFHGLMRDTPMYEVDVQEEVFISDSGDVAETLNELREMLGLKAMPVAEPDETVDETDAEEKKE